MASKATAPSAKRPAYSWTQPCCQECWNGMTVKIGRPSKSDKTEFCCHCRSDIPAGKGYMTRVNPGSVPYPTIRKDQE